MASYTFDQIKEAMNQACNDIKHAAGLPDAGTADALYLLVNATLHYLDFPEDRSLDAAVQENYSVDLDDVLKWITS